MVLVQIRVIQNELLDSGLDFLKEPHYGISACRPLDFVILTFLFLSSCTSTDRFPYTMVFPPRMNQMDGDERTRTHALFSNVSFSLRHFLFLFVLFSILSFPLERLHQMSILKLRAGSESTIQVVFKLPTNARYTYACFY